MSVAALNAPRLGIHCTLQRMSEMEKTESQGRNNRVYSNFIYNTFAPLEIIPRRFPKAATLKLSQLLSKRTSNIYVIL